MTAATDIPERNDGLHAGPGPLPWSWRDWAVVLLLLLMVCLFFWRLLTPNPSDRASFPPGDFVYQFWAFASLEVRELAAGHLPLWNPFTYAGAPFWADIQSAVLYPVSLVTVLLSLPFSLSLVALEIEAILHFWLAGCFTYLFARRVIGFRPGAVLAAIVFAFGGYLTGYPSQQLAVLETDIWLPLLLWFIDVALVDRSGAAPLLRGAPSLPHVAGAGLVWGVALLAGHPQSAMLVFYSFTLYTAFVALAYPHSAATPAGSARWVTRWWTRIRRPAGYWLVIVVMGLGLSAVAWLPGLEYMRLSVRAAGYYDKMSGGFPLYDPIQLLLPGSVSQYSPLYVGLLPLVLAVWVAVTFRRRELMFWGGMAVACLLLSFGGSTFLYSPFYLLAPGFAIFRDQERLAFVFSWCLSVLAGYGFTFLLDVGAGVAVKNWAPLRRVVGWLFAGGVGLVFLFFYGLNSQGWQDTSPFYGLLNRCIWLTVLAGVSWGLLHILPTRQANSSRVPIRLARSALPAAFLFVVGLDLFTVNWKTNVFAAPPESHTQPPAVVTAIVADASADRSFRVYNEYRVFENYGVPFQLEDTWGASPLRLARYDAVFHTLRMERLWQLLNVKYVITWRRALYAPSEVIFSEGEGDQTTYVHRLSSVAPRAWMVYLVEEVADDAALIRLDAPEFDPATSAIIPPGTGLVTQQPSGGESGKVTIVDRTSNSLTLHVDTPSDGLLVLSEAFYPGWRVRIDGIPASLVRTDFILRGLPLASGEHTVSMTFAPTSLLVGAALSLTTLVAALAVALVAARSAARPSHS